MEGRSTRTTKEKKRQEVGHWIKPQSGEQKMNCDVAVLGDGKIGMGFLIRDQHGTDVLTGKQENFASGGSTVLESISMRFACQMANQYKLQVHVIKSDSKILIDSLNSHSSAHVYCDVVLEDIKKLALNLGCKSFEFVKRDGNQTAHFEARGLDFLSIRHTPSHLETLVKDDSF